MSRRTVGAHRDRRMQAPTRPQFDACHVVTDPACDFYVEPISWHERQRFDRARGRGCTTCLGGEPDA